MNNIYPISKEGHQCISTCTKNKYITNPLFMIQSKPVVDKYGCATMPYPSYTDDKRIEYFDQCDIEDSKYEENIISTLIPSFDIFGNVFIKTYYNINSLEEFLKWFDDNNELLYETKKRVFNNGMYIYGKDIIILDHRFVSHITYILEYNIHKIYKSIRKYINIDNNNITLIKPKKNIDINDDKKTIKLIRIYIKKQFLNNKFIYKYLSKFLQHYKKNLTDINLTDTIINNMIEYIIKCINLSFD